MADDDDIVESKPSSLGMISDFLSSLTSVGTSDSASECTESSEVEQTDSQLEADENTTDVESAGSTDDDGFVERRQSSLERITDFFSSFTSAGSSNDSSSEIKTADEEATSDSSALNLQESSDSADQSTNEADSGAITEDDAIVERRQSSLEKISDFLSSFTSSSSTSSTETTSDNNNQTDEDNKAKQENENLENEDVILIDDDSEGTGSEGRLRSSSSRIFTEPESIDKKDLDYVTLVSS